MKEGKGMGKFQKMLAYIPQLLSSNASIFIYLFLFCYLVLWALLTQLVPALQAAAPSSDSQLILGNYTNVLSALGASIAAGAGSQTHKSAKQLHRKHAELHQSIQALHAKLDAVQTAMGVKPETSEKVAE